MADIESTGSLDVRQELRDRGCLYLDTGNQFIGISGKHLTGYCNVDPALADVKFMSQMGRNLVEPYLDDNIEAVLVPAIGAIPLAQWGPHHLMEANGGNIPGAWADKVKPRGFVLERNGFRRAIADKRVLILEDMINQMFSAGELVKVARDVGSFVVGVGAIAANKGVSAEAMQVPKFNRLCEVAYEAFTPEDCETHGPCSEGRPIVINEALGHGAEYQKEHADYHGGYITIPEPV
jgi:orotate phosphoribosyltransferase